MKTGQKVICVDDSMPPLEVFQHFDYWIQKDNVYVIRGTRMWYGKLSLLLEGLNNPLMYNPEIMAKCEPGYSAERFRLLNPLAEDLVNIIEEELELKIAA